MRTIGVGVSSLGLLLAVACESTTEEKTRAMCTADAAVSQANCASDSGPRPTAIPLRASSCFPSEASCWENTSSEGADALTALCEALGATQYSWPCSDSVSRHAVAATCEDAERHLRQTLYFQEDAVPSCETGLIHQPGNATPVLVEACASILEALGPIPPPDCSAPSMRTDLEECVDEVAFLDPACADCMLANAHWSVGAGTDPATGVVDCTYLFFGNPRYVCPDTCP